MPAANSRPPNQRTGRPTILVTPSTRTNASSRSNPTQGLSGPIGMRSIAVADVTEYETHYPHRIHVVCPCDALDIDFSHDVPANHVFAEGTCERSGASLDDARTRLVMNDPSVGAFAQEYRVGLRVETDRNGNETPYYVTVAQCPDDECDGETSLSWIEGTTGSALTGHDDHGHCKTCGGAIAAVDWRVGTDRIER